MIRDGEDVSATWPENPTNLREGTPRIVHMLENLGCDHQVETSRWPTKLLEVLVPNAVDNLTRLRAVDELRYLVITPPPWLGEAQAL